MHIGNLIERHAQYRPDHVAVIFDDQRLTYEQFNCRINRLANVILGLGITRGQRVAILLPNCLELLEIYWAAAKLGVVVIPLSPMSLGPGLASLLVDSDAALLFTCKALLPVVEPVKSEQPRLLDGRCMLTDCATAGYLDYASLMEASPQTNPPIVNLCGDDVCNIMYTSCTTGPPKGIVLTHKIRALTGALMANTLRMAPESVVLHTGSLVFNCAFTTLLASAFVGGTCILHRQFDVETLIATVDREKVTHTMMMPSQINAILAAANFDPDTLQSLQMILSLGAPLRREHEQALQRVLPNRLYEIYGLTEGFFTVLDRDDAIRKWGSVGVPPPFSGLRVLREDGSRASSHEIGEIVGRSIILMSDYFKRPDLTEKAIVAGWLHSSDLGYVDEDGFLYLVDHVKDMIDNGGAKVYPGDVASI